MPTTKSKNYLGDVGQGTVAALQSVKQTADAFPPLKSAVAGLLEIIDIVKGFKSNKKEWKAFATRVKNDIEDIQRTASSIEGYKDIPPDLHEAIDHLIKVLTEIRDLISDICGRGKTRRILNVKEDPIKMQSYLEEITRVKDKFNYEVQVASLNGIYHIKEILDRHSVKTFNPGSGEYEAILRWLLADDPLDTYRNILSRRRGEGTGGWLLEDPKFTEWLSNGDTTLWCPGNPGAGKTMLATIIVEHLFGLHKAAGGSIGIACIYLSHKAENQTLEILLRSIVKQLIQRRKSISEKTIDTYICCEDGKISPSKDQLVELLRWEVDNLKETFVVVDALDECSHGVRVALLDELEKLRPKMHLLVTSRDFGTIADRLEGSVKLEIRAQPQDIRAFISAQIDDPENYRLKDFIKLEPKLLHEIEKVIIKTANGMFLLVRLHIESLASKLNRHEVRKALSSLPNTVDDTYALALARIDNQAFEGHRDFAHKVLCWVAYTFRPLTVPELLCALAVDPGDSEFNTDKVALVMDITSLCAGLVIVDHIGGVVRLVHQTMQTYFNTQTVKTDPRFSGILTKMAEICLTCLSFVFRLNQDASNALEDGSDGPDDASADGDLEGTPSETDGCDSDVNSHSLIPSSSQHDSFEDDSHDSDDDESPPSSRFPPRSINLVAEADSEDATSVTLGTDSDELDIVDDSSSETGSDNPDSDDGRSSTKDPDNWLADALLNYAICYWGEHFSSHSAHSDNNSVLLYAADFLCDDVRRNMLTQHMHSNGTYKTTPNNVTALHIAANFGLTELTKTLIGKGCNINAQDGEGNSVLAIAIQAGHEGVMNLLVNAGVFINLFELSGHTVLINAAERDYENLDHRILQTAGGTPQTALLAAAYDGQDTELAQILQHPDLDLKDKHASFGVTALLLATECGRYEVVKALLEHAVDVNAAGGSGAASPALHRAARRGHVKIVKLLLKNKVTVDLRDHEGRTAWTYSIMMHQRKISDILQKAGADPNTQESAGVNPLYGAAAAGHLEDVKFLLDCGTDPSILTDYGWAPLHWAAAGGYYEVVKVLLKHGAEPSPLSDTLLTPLDKARENDRTEVVKLLEKAGAISGLEVQARHALVDEDTEDSMTSECDEDLKDSHPRIICYHQTHYLRNGDFVSLLPLIKNTPSVTHVILAAIHLNEGPGNIHLNDDPPSHPKFTALWTEALILQKAGIKVLGMLGGAAAGTFARLDGLEFEAYYSPLKDMITAHSLDGLDLDVEEHMSLSGIIQLIDRLKDDFGNDFLVTLAPVATAFTGGPNLSGFDYRTLEATRGDKITWYNSQFYCGWGNIRDYSTIIESGWLPSKVVVGLVTNPANASGWVSQDVLEMVLMELKRKYPDFGGVMGWEYFNSLPGGEEKPWEWGAIMGSLLSGGTNPDEA